MLKLCSALLLVCFLSSPALSQDMARIAGTITDSKGLPVAGAVIEVRQRETGLVRSGRSAESGTYFFDLLPIGTYSIEITYAGFVQASSQDVRLFAGETRTVDAALDRLE
jgi:hypothetical protein